MRFKKLAITICAISLISPLNVFAEVNNDKNSEVLTISNTETTMPISTEVEETLPISNVETIGETKKEVLDEEDETYLILALLAIVLVGLGVIIGRNKKSKEEVNEIEKYYEDREEIKDEEVEVQEETQEEIKEEVEEEK